MKKYLLLTAAFISMTGITYASLSQDEESSRPSSSQPTSDATQEIQSIIKRYALDNLSCTAFADLNTQQEVSIKGHTYHFPVIGASQEEDELLRNEARKLLPSGSLYASNLFRALNVISAYEDLERKTVVITYGYEQPTHINLYESWWKGKTQQKTYQFVVEADLTAKDLDRIKQLKALEQPSSNDLLLTRLNLASSNASISPELSSSSSEGTLSTDFDSAELDRLLAKVAELERENSLLKSSVSPVSISSPMLVAPESSLGGDLPPPPPPPPAPGMGGMGSRPKAQKVVVLSSDFQLLYEALDQEIKTTVSQWNQTRIELYLKLCENKGGDAVASFLSFTETQAQKVMKMKTYTDQIAYVLLSDEDRLKRDTADAKKEEEMANQAGMQNNMLGELLSKTQRIEITETLEKKQEEDRAITALTPSYSDILNLQLSEGEQTSFDKAKLVWSKVSAQRKAQLLEFYKNDFILKNLLLKAIEGQIVTLDSKNKGYYTPYTILKAGQSLLKQQKETPVELRFTAENIRDFAISAILQAKAVGFNGEQVRPLIEALRAVKFQK